MLLSASSPVAEKLWLLPVATDTGEAGVLPVIVGARFSGAVSLTCTVQVSDTDSPSVSVKVTFTVKLPALPKV